MATVGARPGHQGHREQSAMSLGADDDLGAALRRVEVGRLRDRHVALQRVETRHPVGRCIGQQHAGQRGECGVGHRRPVQQFVRLRWRQRFEFVELPGQAALVRHSGDDRFVQAEAHVGQRPRGHRRRLARRLLDRRQHDAEPLSGDGCAVACCLGAGALRVRRAPGQECEQRERDADREGSQRCSHGVRPACRSST